MATSIVPVSTAAYTLVSSSSDVLVSNASTTVLMFRFDTTLPSASTKGHPLPPMAGIQKSSGVPSNNLYVIALDFDGEVAVSE